MNWVAGHQVDVGECVLENYLCLFLFDTFIYYFVLFLNYIGQYYIL